MPAHTRHTVWHYPAWLVVQCSKCWLAALEHGVAGNDGEPLSCHGDRHLPWGAAVCLAHGNEQWRFNELLKRLAHLLPGSNTLHLDPFSIVKGL